MKEDKFMPLVRVDMIKGKTSEYKKIKYNYKEVDFKVVY